MLRIDRRFAIAAILAFLAVIGAFAPAAWAQRNKCYQACYDQVGCGSGTPYDCTAADRRAVSKCLARCPR